ncbi:putative membrane protein [Marinomonas primoryensis]|uniref:Putative membrane protein n=1 Tax=Marinomonas primoryensis TaxID=178399 RepID=A0A859CYY9_9GAMM|nr:putative membrane protein [Marinomonas primoryensis]
MMIFVNDLPGIFYCQKIKTYCIIGWFFSNKMSLTGLIITLMSLDFINE